MFDLGSHFRSQQFLLLQSTWKINIRASCFLQRGVVRSDKAGNVP